MFEYMNGFRKTLYWSKSKMENHAMKYSAGYKAKKGYTFWEKDFDGMAYKTMLRQLISKWGIMSIDLQTAMEKDQTLIKDDGNFEYIDSVDNGEIPTETEVVEVQTDQQPAENKTDGEKDNKDNQFFL